MIFIKMKPFFYSGVSLSSRLQRSFVAYKRAGFAKKFSLQRWLSIARSFLVFSTVTFVLSGCGGGSSGDTQGPITTPSDELPISSNPVSNTVQDVWLYQSISIVPQDGESVDITASILESLQDDLADPFALYGNVTFSATTKLQPQILNASGQVRDHIHVMAGILSDGDVSGLAVIATPDTTIGTLVEREDKLEIDLSALPINVQLGDLILAEHYFAVVVVDEDEASSSNSKPANVFSTSANALVMQTLTRSDGNGARVVENLTSFAKWADRGNAAVQAIQEGAIKKYALANAIATVAAPQLKAQFDAKSHAMLDGVVGGVTSCITAPGVLCIGKTFNSLERGAIKSLNAIDSNFPPTPAPPVTQPPAPFDGPDPSDGPDSGSEPGSRPPRLCIGRCGFVANDPHIATFDGRDYSPQPVGEMTALIHTPPSGIPMEMQWRFGALNDSSFASVTTAVAFGFGDTRITLDVERDVLIAVNGEPVDLSFFPEKQLTSAALGLVLADRIGVIELEYEQWLFSIRVGSKHLNIIASAPEDATDVAGLLGNLDDNPDNDLASRDGTAILGYDATIDALYNVFLNSWRITDDTSLFDYGVGESTATYTDLSFPAFPEGVATQVTLATDVSALLTLGLDTRQADGACRRAGITDEPLFGNCVADYVLSGNTEFIVGQQQALDVIRRDRLNRFGEGINGRDFIWWHIFTGSIDTEMRPEVVSNGRILLLRSLDKERRALIDAVDGLTGRWLWRLEDTQNDCTPISIGDNLMMLQADGRTEFGGNDRSDDLLLVDAQTGTILDRWEPTNDFLPKCTSALQLTSDNTLVYVGISTQYGFSIVDNQISMLWEHRFDADEVFSAGRSLNLKNEAIVNGNNLYLYGSDRTDDGVMQFSVYQLDTKTGVVVDRLETSLTSNQGFLSVGSSHIALLQQTVGANDVQKIQLIKTPTVNNNEKLELLWELDNSATTVPIEFIVGESAAYHDDNTFGIWALGENSSSVIAEFDILTGGVNALISAVGVQQNGPILRLKNGDYVTAPPVLTYDDVEPGSPMVQGLSADNPTLWSINRVEGIEYPSTLHLLDNDRLVMVVPLTNILDTDSLFTEYTEWAVVAMGTKR